MIEAKAKVELQTKAAVAFISALKGAGYDSIPFGGELLPRNRWAPCMLAALIAVGAVSSEEQADKLLAILDSELGNSSQYGSKLLKLGHIKRQEASAAAFDFAAMLKAQAAPQN